MRQIDGPLQQRDTVLALVLILLLLFFFIRETAILYAMAAVLVLGMTVPRLFAPLARLWFGFSHALGFVMSRLLMGILFFGLVTPVGLFRRLLGKDVLALRQWKKGRTSVFTRRDHVISASDLERPY